jgi:hypothetical protein
VPPREAGLTDGVGAGVRARAKPEGKAEPTAVDGEPVAEPPAVALPDVRVPGVDLVGATC